MLDVVAAGAASAVEPLAILHSDRDSADLHRSGDLPFVHLGEFLVVADDASAVAHDVEGFPFLVDGLAEVVAEFVIVVEELDLTDDGATLGVLEGNHSRLLVDSQ